MKHSSIRYKIPNILKIEFYIPSSLSISCVYFNKNKIYVGTDKGNHYIFIVNESATSWEIISKSEIFNGFLNGGKILYISDKHAICSNLISSFKGNAWMSKNMTPKIVCCTSNCESFARKDGKIHFWNYHYKHEIVPKKIDSMSYFLGINKEVKQHIEIVSLGLDYTKQFLFVGGINGNIFIYNIPKTTDPKFREIKISNNKFIFTGNMTFMCCGLNTKGIILFTNKGCVYMVNKKGVIRKLNGLDKVKFGLCCTNGFLVCATKQEIVLYNMILDEVEFKHKIVVDGIGGEIVGLKRVFDDKEIYVIIRNKRERGKEGIII